jgi:hypothetical protein
MALIACAGDADPAAPGQGGSDAGDTSAIKPPAVAEPPAPRATLTTRRGAVVEAGLGSRCWDGACIDYEGPVTNAQPLLLGRDEAFSVKFEAGTPATTSSAWLPVTRAPSGDGDTIVWEDLDPNLMRDEPGASNMFLGPGRFIFLIKATWPDHGDVVYGFYIERQ